MNPLAIAPDDFQGDPEPDIAIVEGEHGDRRYDDAHPKTALLVVEVAGTSLRKDRKRKASLYASAKIEDYWVVA